MLTTCRPGTTRTIAVQTLCNKKTIHCANLIRQQHSTPLPTTVRYKAKSVPPTVKTRYAAAAPTTRRIPTVSNHANGSVTVRSFAEFGYELVCIVPYAHWQGQHGLLASTVGVAGSHANFFFSPSHVEMVRISRHQDNDPTYGISRGVDGLNPRLHDRPFRLHRWEPPAFRMHYATHPLALALRRRWPRLVVVHNKRSSWPETPQHRGEFSEVQLDALLGLLRRTHNLTPLYVCSSGGSRYAGFTADGREASVKSSCHFDAVVARHGGVALHDVLAEPSLMAAAPALATAASKSNQTTAVHAYGWNVVQYAAHAAARRFVSNQGGSAIVASYFGGINLVYDVWPGSGERHSDEYTGLHPRLSNATVLLATSFESLIQQAALQLTLR